MTTEKYDATYQCDGLTGNTSSGWVPNEPPMISIDTIGKTSTNVSVIGSRPISRSSVLSSRRVAEGCRVRGAASGSGGFGWCGSGSGWSSRSFFLGVGRVLRAR